MLYEFFVVGSLFFWIVLSALTIFVFGCLSDRNYIFPGIVIVVVGLAYFLFGDLVKYLPTDNWTIGAIILGYPALGAIYALGKLRWVAGRIKSSVSRGMTEFVLTKQNLIDFNKGQYNDADDKEYGILVRKFYKKVDEDIDNYSVYYNNDGRWVFRDMTDWLWAWFFMYPFDIVWSIIDEYVLGIWKKIKKLGQRIWDGVFKDLNTI